MFGMTGPWSVLQAGESDDEDLMLSLGWLAFRLVRKLEGQGGHAFLSWSERALETGCRKGLSIALYGAVVSATKSRGVLLKRALTVVDTCFLVLITCINDPNGVGAFGAAMRYLASILSKGQSENFDWTSSTPQLVLARILCRLQGTSSTLVKAKSRWVRSGFAVLLWNLKTWMALPDPPEAAWLSLRDDSRASVRFAALGGWGAEARRRYKSDIGD